MLTTGEILALILAGVFVAITGLFVIFYQVQAHHDRAVMEQKIEKMKENLDEQTKKIQKERGE